MSVGADFDAALDAGSSPAISTKFNRAQPVACKLVTARIYSRPTTITTTMEQLFSPWRSKYMESFKENTRKTDSKSIFADIPPEEDEMRMVVYRGKTSFIIMNLYPYNAGHLMIIPYKQTPNFSDLDSETRLEIMNLIDLSMKALTEILSPHGFNVGLNLGSVAGGSVDSHIHFHVVPRWHGDTNFMPVLADTKVISNDMRELYYKLRDTMQKLSKPQLPMNAQELVEQLREASKDLLMPSESDYPFEIFQWNDAMPTMDEVLQRGGYAEDTPVESVDLDYLFQNLAEEKDWHDDVQKAQVPKFRQFADLMKTHLKGLQVYRVGTVEIDVYAVGRIGNDVVGFKTKVIET